MDFGMAFIKAFIHEQRLVRENSPRSRVASTNGEGTRDTRLCFAAEKRDAILDSAEGRHCNPITEKEAQKSDSPVQKEKQIENQVANKLLYPEYDGSKEPFQWLYKCGFFLTQQIKEVERTELAAFHLQGQHSHGSSASKGTRALHLSKCSRQLSGNVSAQHLHKTYSTSQQPNKQVGLRNIQISFSAISTRWIASTPTNR